MFPDLLSDPSLPLKLRIARPQEENDFRSLLNEVPMKKGILSITTDLPSPLEESLRHDRRGLTKPILFEDSSGLKCGCASFSIWDSEASRRIGLAADHTTSKVGYFADLRLSPGASRDLRNHWREVYRSWIELLQSPLSPVELDAIVTSILDENKIALRALARGRGGIHYLPIYSYTSLSLLLNPQGPVANEESAVAELCGLGISYSFHNPNRYWIVEIAGQGLQKLSYFTLSKFEGMDRLSAEEKTQAWQSLQVVAHSWSVRHQRPLFQAAAIGARPEYWDISSAAEGQRWEAPATIYQVTLGPEAQPTITSLDGQYIDASQL